MADHYTDADGVDHLGYDTTQAVVFRKVMKHHMDVCHAAGLDGLAAANLLLNGAGYLIGAVYSELPRERERLKDQMTAVFRSKVDQAVFEGRRDRQKPV